MNEKKLTKEDLQFINETARQISYVLNCGGAITMSWGMCWIRKSKPTMTKVRNMSNK